MPCFVQDFKISNIAGEFHAMKRGRGGKKQKAITGEIHGAEYVDLLFISVLEPPPLQRASVDLCSSPFSSPFRMYKVKTAYFLVLFIDNTPSRK